MVRGKHVVYLAIQPPPEAAAQALARLDASSQRRRLSARPVAPERLHVSLFHVGDFKRPPTPVFDKVIAALSVVDTRPFVVEFNRLGTWPAGDPPRPVVLWGDEGVIGVTGLYSAIFRAMRRIDMAPRREPEMTPHMTLVYDKAEVPETFIEPVSWMVEEFVLIHAVHGEGRFEVVGRVPLNG